MHCCNSIVYLLFFNDERKEDILGYDFSLSSRYERWVNTVL